jgi:hypothetical protein
MYSYQSIYYILIYLSTLPYQHVPYNHSSDILHTYPSPLYYHTNYQNQIQTLNIQSQHINHSLNYQIIHHSHLSLVQIAYYNARSFIPDNTKVIGIVEFLYSL